MARALLFVIAAGCSAPVEHGTTAPTRPTQAGSATPTTKPVPQPSDGPLAISLRNSGEIRIADDPVDDTTLDSKLREAAARDPEVQVYVQVDSAVARERVHDVITRAQAAGLKQIAVTDLPPDNVPATPMSPIGLVWDMRVEGDQLRIEYTITNSTDHRITAVDALWKTGVDFDADSIIVRADSRPDTIALTRAFVRPGPNWKIEHVDRKAPHYADVPPHGELRGTAHTKLPLGAAHNFSGIYAITGTRTTAVLEVGFFEDATADASSVGETRHQPDKLLRGVIKRLPAGAKLASPEEQVARGRDVVLPRH